MDPMTAERGTPAMQLMKWNHCTPTLETFQGCRLLLYEVQIEAENSSWSSVYFQRLSGIGEKNTPEIFTNAMRSVSKTRGLDAKNLTENHLCCLTEGNLSKFKVSVTVMETGFSKHEIKSNKSVETLEKIPSCSKWKPQKIDMNNSLMFKLFSLKVNLFKGLEDLELYVSFQTPSYVTN